MGTVRPISKPAERFQYTLSKSEPGTPPVKLVWLQWLSQAYVGAPRIADDVVRDVSQNGAKAAHRSVDATG